MPNWTHEDTGEIIHDQVEEDKKKDEVVETTTVNRNETATSSTDRIKIKITGDDLAVRDEYGNVTQGLVPGGGKEYEVSDVSIDGLVLVRYKSSAGNDQTAWVDMNDERVSFVDEVDGPRIYQEIKDSKYADYQDAYNKSLSEYSSSNLERLKEEYENGTEALNGNRKTFNDHYNTNPDTEWELVSRSLDVKALSSDTNGENGENNLESYGRRLIRVFGTQPQWSKYVDPRIEIFGAYGVYGRRYASTILTNTTIISLSPGVLKYRGSAEKLEELASGDGSESLQDSDNDVLWGFVPKWNSPGVNDSGYIQYLTTLCRYAILAMSAAEPPPGDVEGVDTSLAGRPVPDVFSGIMRSGLDISRDINTTYRFFDPSFFLGMDEPSWLSVGQNLGFADANGEMKETHFVHFAATGQVSPRETFNTSIRPSVIEQYVSGAVSDVVKDIAFLTSGTGFGSGVTQDLDAVKDYIAGSIPGIGNILSAAVDTFTGGRIVFPKVIDDVSWGREYSFSVKFVSLYGDCESRFLNVVFPYLSLMCLFLPKQLSSGLDMYTLPFVVQAYARGIFACPCGVLTSINVTRGGGDDTGWTESGQLMEIDVDFSITPMHDKLFMSSTPAWFVKNTGIQQYLGTICGVDLTIPQIQLRAWTKQMVLQSFVELYNGKAIYNIMKRVENYLSEKGVRTIVENFLSSVEALDSAKENLS